MQSNKLLGGGIIEKNIEKNKATFQIKRETSARLEKYWLKVRQNGEKIFKNNIVDEAINFYIDYKEGNSAKFKEVNLQEILEVTNEITNDVEVSIKNFEL